MKPILTAISPVKIGVYQTTPERMFHYYAAPQSTGNRTDVRWVKLADTSGEGIFVESDRAFQFSIIPFSDVLLEKPPPYQ